MRTLSDAAQNLLVAEINQHHANVNGAKVYLHSRGIGDAAIDKFKLGFDGSRLTIPYLTPVGAWYVKRRCIAAHDCKAVNCDKYLYAAGAEVRLFNAQTLRTATAVVAVEGELDAITGEMCGVPHVGVPGVKMWKQNSKSWIHCFDSVDEFVFVADGDEPQPGRKVGVGEELGQAVVADIRKAYPDMIVRLIVLPAGHDANSYVLQFGRAAYLEKIGL